MLIDVRSNDQQNIFYVKSALYNLKKKSKQRNKHELKLFLKTNNISQ